MPTDPLPPPPLPAHSPRPADAPVALDGIRVVDFSHFLAGPLATMLLGDLGAEVIKIEKPDGGDDFRTFRPRVGPDDDVSAAFMWANRNKRSIALDLKRPQGRQVALDLAVTADVVVENFSAGVMASLGLDYATLATLNPRLVYCAVSAYGRSGPDADRLGFDPIVQAETGFMSLTGHPDGEPTRSGPAIMDMSTGMMACNAVLGALMARHRHGLGQYLEVSLFDTATLMLGFHAANYLVTGVPHRRTGNTSSDAAPVGVFDAADGPLYLAVANDRIFRRLATDVLRRPDLADDPDFAHASARVRNRFRLAAQLETVLASAPREYWLDRMRAAGVPAGAVRTLDEGLGSAEMAGRATLSRIEHPTLGPLPNMAPPFRLAGTPVVDPVAAPTVGQHTAEILADVLGYGPDQIAALTQSGAVGPQAPSTIAP
ncbi:MAG: CoA transferase [Acidimicrobiia bacterium]|nr:CoA transferase [Acidimicrobiia bacterium]MDH4362544.1 CoA transferase [Acidimicrobiia bacterium]